VLRQKQNLEAYYKYVEGFCDRAVLCSQRCSGHKMDSLFTREALGLGNKKTKQSKIVLTKGGLQICLRIFLFMVVP
jgi:hypothetical protein